MKKLIATILFLSTVLAMVGCAKQSTGQTNSAEESNDYQSQTTQESEDTTAVLDSAYEDDSSAESFVESYDSEDEVSSAEESENESEESLDSSSVPAESSFVPPESSLDLPTESEASCEGAGISSACSDSSEESSAYAEPDQIRWTNTLIGQQSTDYCGFSAQELDAYFDGALITGDSVTNGLKLYAQSYEKIFSGVVFHTGASYGFNNALSPVTDNSQHPLYRGQRRTIWDMVALTDAKRIFIGFGLNDFGYSTKQRISSCLDTITTKIYAVAPDAEIIFLSSGYFTESGEVYRPQINDNRTNARQREYNQYVLDYCNQNGLDYIDVSNCFSDENGYLISDISLDDYCHPQIKKYTVWRDILYSYAAHKMLGIYENPTAMS